MRRSTAPSWPMRAHEAALQAAVTTSVTSAGPSRRTVVLATGASDTTAGPWAVPGVDAITSSGRTRTGARRVIAACSSIDCPRSPTVMQVRFERVTKRFGRRLALRDVDLTVEAGECLVLLGPSGCGKTTFAAPGRRPGVGRLRAHPHRDRIVNDVPPSARDVAMVFQNYALYPT